MLPLVMSMMAGDGGDGDVAMILTMSSVGGSMTVID